MKKYVFIIFFLITVSFNTNHAYGDSIKTITEISNIIDTCNTWFNAVRAAMVATQLVTCVIPPNFCVQFWTMSNPLSTLRCEGKDLPQAPQSVTCGPLVPFCESVACKINKRLTIIGFSITAIKFIIDKIKDKMQVAIGTPEENPDITEPEPEPEVLCENLEPASNEQARCYCETIGLSWDEAKGLCVETNEEPEVEPEEEIIEKSNSVFAESDVLVENEDDSNSSYEKLSVSNENKTNHSRENSSSLNNLNFNKLKKGLDDIKNKMNVLSSAQFNTANISDNSKINSKGNTISNSELATKIAKKTDDIFKQISAKYHNYKITLKTIQK